MLLSLIDEHWLDGIGFRRSHEKGGSFLGQRYVVDEGLLPSKNMQRLFQHLPSHAKEMGA